MKNKPTHHRVSQHRSEWTIIITHLDDKTTKNTLRSVCNSLRSTCSKKNPGLYVFDQDVPRYMHATFFGYHNLIWNKNIRQLASSNTFVFSHTMAQSGYNILHVAAFSKQAQFITFITNGLTLSEHNKLVCQTSTKGETPLLLATKRNDARTVLSLLYIESVGTTSALNIADNHGITPVLQAVLHQNKDIVRLLLEKSTTDTMRTYSSDSDNERQRRAFNNSTILHIALSYRNTDIARLLLEHNPELINICTDYSYSPLHLCILIPDVQGVQLLLSPERKIKADLTIKNRYKQSPLQLAYLMKKKYNNKREQAKFTQINAIISLLTK